MDCPRINGSIKFTFRGNAANMISRAAFHCHRPEGCGVLVKLEFLDPYFKFHPLHEPEARNVEPPETNSSA